MRSLKHTKPGAVLPENNFLVRGAAGSGAQPTAQPGDGHAPGKGSPQGSTGTHRHVCLDPSRVLGSWAPPVFPARHGALITSSGLHLVSLFPPHSTHPTALGLMRKPFTRPPGPRRPVQSHLLPLRSHSALQTRVPQGQGRPALPATPHPLQFQGFWPCASLCPEHPPQHPPPTHNPI